MRRSSAAARPAARRRRRRCRRRRSATLDACTRSSAASGQPRRGAAPAATPLRSAPPRPPPSSCCVGEAPVGRAAGAAPPDHPGSAAGARAAPPPRSVNDDSRRAPRRPLRRRSASGAARRRVWSGDRVGARRAHAAICTALCAFARCRRRSARSASSRASRAARGRPPAVWPARGSRPVARSTPPLSERAAGCLPRLIDSSRRCSSRSSLSLSGAAPRRRCAGWRRGRWHRCGAVAALGAGAARRRGGLVYDLSGCQSGWGWPLSAPLHAPPVPASDCFGPAGGASDAAAWLSAGCSAGRCASPSFGGAAAISSCCFCCSC